MRFGLILAAAALPACFAQQYEVGVAGGGGFVRGVPITAPAGSATAGFQNGGVFGAVLGHRLYPNVSGEIRYSFMQSDLKLSAGGLDPTFRGDAHAIHYDFLIHPAKSHAKVQPFAAVGGGVKVYRGTGRESASQPLSQYAYMTKTLEWKPLISVGGGVRIELAPRISLRLDFRDYLTPFPKTLIAPGRGADIKGWLHDFVPMVGISFLL